MPIHEYSKSHPGLDIQLLLHPNFKISEHAALYLTNTLRTLSIAFVGVFLPIYIFQLAADYMIFSTNEFINGVTWVLLYFFLRSISTLIASMSLLHKIFKDWKFSKSIGISLGLLALEMLFWILAENNLYFILLGGALAGWKVVTYWIPFHIFFIQKCKKSSNHFGKPIAKRAFLSRLASTVAPAIGGIVIANYGFRALFMLSLIVLAIAALPTLFIVHDWEHKSHSARRIIKNALFDSRYKTLFFSYFFQSLDSSIFMVFWPIMIFLTLSDFKEIGFLAGISMLASSLITLLVGKLVDKYGSKKVHIFGIINNSLLYIARLFINSPFGIYAVDIVDKANSPFYNTPNMSISYEKARTLGKSDFIIFRELALHFSTAFVISIVLILLPILPNWKYLFILAAIGSLGTYLFDLDKN